VPIFVDTSAIFSALSRTDENHQSARHQWVKLLTGDEPLVTSNYVLVETTALLARRLGFQAVRVFEIEFAGALDVVWVDEPVHRRAVAALLTAGHRDLSLVDCVSFELMRQLALSTAFAYDAHFLRQGWNCIPEGTS
jgi:uncharacterized protein